MNAVCEHVEFDADTALCVLAGPTPPGAVVVSCPCCGLRGYQQADDHEPNPCPYCGVDAVRL